MLTLDLRMARWPEDVDLVRRLFREYAASLNVDLTFQNFEAELAGLPGRYIPPKGCVLLAFVAGEAIGCVALRPLNESSCEMKRLYVVAKARGMQAGRQLVAQICEEARVIGYRLIYLDTLPNMTAAQSLYESMGFKNTDSYVFNPIVGACYMLREIQQPPIKVE